MAMELIGVAGMTPELKQFYDKKLLSVAETDAVFLQWGVKRPIPARGGKSVEFRRFERITITAGSYTLTEGTPPAVTQGTISSVAGTISQYGQYTQITDLLETQGYDSIIAEWSEKYGLAMSEGLDIVVRNGLSSATTLQYSDTAIQVGTSGTGSVGSGNYLDAAELLEMDRTLRRNGARKYQTPNGPRWMCFIHPDNKLDLMQDPDISDNFVNAMPPGPQNPVIAGVVGDWMGIRFVETNNLRLRTSYGMSGADIYEVIMMGQEFYGVTELSALQARMIIHPRGTGGHTDPLEQYSTIGWKAALATVILNNSFGGIIYCASSRSNSA